MRAFPRTLRFVVACFLLCYGCVLHVVPVAAGLSPSQPTGTTAISSTRDADLIAVRRALEHKLVAQKLRDYGLSTTEVEVRLAGMSDQDLHTLASAARGLPSGSDGLGTLVTVLIIILLVIVILKLLNKDIVIR